MAIVQYNGAKPSLIERIRLPLQRSQEKAAPFAVGREYLLPQAYWMDTTARAYFEQGYRLNSAVYACSRALATGFAEAPLFCYTDETKKKPIPNHPLRLRIKRPNELMGEDEFWKYWITYAANGGNAYGVVVPTNAGDPTGEIWPYNDTKVHPIPKGKNWVDHYIYKAEYDNYAEEIDTKNVLHYKWAIDPLCEYKGMSALQPVAREVATDNELTRYLKALLQNDAVPRTLLIPSSDRPMTQDARDKLKLDWKRLFSGDRIGDVVVTEPGMDVKRLALNLEELAFDALRGVPEARIASAYGVPAIVAGLNIGLARSTYSNFEEARRMFTEQTLVPLWKSVASEVQQSLVPLFGNDCYVDFDLTAVRALGDNIAVKAVWVVNAWDKGVLTLNQTLTELGQATLPGPEGEERKKPAPAPTFGAPPADEAPAPQAVQEPDAEEGADGKALQLKALSKPVEAIAAKMEAAMEKTLSKAYNDLAGHVGG